MIKYMIALFVLVGSAAPRLDGAAPGKSEKLAKKVPATPAQVAKKKAKAASSQGIKKVAAKSPASQKQGKKNAAERDIYRWFQTYSEVISLIENKGFRHVDFGQFIQDSLKAAVAHVDAHSAFFSRDSYKSALESTSGEFSGIGVSIISKTPEDEALAIIDVTQQGPAAKAGMQAGDKVVEVAGEKLRGLSTDEVVAKLKGRVGTDLVLKVIRDKKPLDFKVRREIIKDQTSLCYLFKRQGVYYLSLKVFNEKSADQISVLLSKANEGRCHGIILDLRRNPGGTLDSAIEMAELFLDKDSLVALTRDRNRTIVSEYKTSKASQFNSDVPIFILIDNFTASAAEILAGSLKYHSEHAQGKRKLMVFLLGTSTFGKGSVQELIPIKNGCALKITSMLYYLPGDFSIQAEGIAPDFLVKPKFIPTDEMKWINELYGKESSLKHFITKEEVTGNKDGLAPKKSRKKKAKKDDGFWQRWFGSDDAASADDLDDEEEDGDDEFEHPVNNDEPAAPAAVEEDPSKDWETKQQEALVSDCQVQAAVNMISMLHFVKKATPALVDGRKKALEFLKGYFLTDDAPELERIKE